MVHRETTSHIIRASFEVHNALGYGFLEKVYQQAMQIELIKRGSQAELEVPIKVFYKSAVFGEYYADLLVDGSVMVEIKMAKRSNPEDEAQLLNELKATAAKVWDACQFRALTRSIQKNDPMIRVPSVPIRDSLRPSEDSIGNSTAF